MSKTGKVTNLNVVKKNSKILKYYGDLFDELLDFKELKGIASGITFSPDDNIAGYVSFGNPPGTIPPLFNGFPPIHVFELES
mgnify:CR=1 FL=1